jgi:transcriptional regulator with XRE-family HTH domain
MDKTIYTREYAVLLRLLRKIREDASVTQVELAKRLKETQSAVSKIERGERRVDVVELRTICQALGVPFLGFMKLLERELT